LDAEHVWSSATLLEHAGTKYGEFLEQTEREVITAGSDSYPRPPAPRRLNTEALNSAHDGSGKLTEAHKPNEQSTPEGRQREMELDGDGEVVRRGLVPDSELLISRRKLEDLELSQQIHSEIVEAAERGRRAMEHVLAEEKRRQEEEELRRQEAASRQREAEEELRRQREEKLDQRLAEIGLRFPTRPIIAPMTKYWQ
jgi:hypothetical protein